MRAVHAVHAVHLLCREYMEIPSASKNIIHGSLQEKHEINIVKRISKFQKTYIHFICKVILLYLANSLLRCKSIIFLLQELYFLKEFSEEYYQLQWLLQVNTRKFSPKTRVWVLVFTETTGQGEYLHPDPCWGENFLVFTGNSHCDDFILWGKSVVHELRLKKLVNTIKYQKLVFTCENWYSPVNTRFWQVNTINVLIQYLFVVFWPIRLRLLRPS